MPLHVRCLKSCIDVIPCSTAECERGFSCMNIVYTDLRNPLLVSNVSFPLFIKIHGPPLSLNGNRKSRPTSVLGCERIGQQKTLRCDVLLHAVEPKNSALWQFL